MMERSIVIFIFIFWSTLVTGQIDSTKFPIKINGYVETYYCYDFNNPADHYRPDFIYSYNRHNEVNINLGLIRAAYEKGNTRANVALMAGTYPNANLSSEPGVLKNIYEANIGMRISKKKLWIDAGIFPSHIGFESAIGKDCWNLTRSLLAENSPYYESGLKLSYTSNNNKWFMCALILNGWQHIQRNDGNNTPAFGHQLTYKPNSKIILNSSSFVGNDKPDSLIQMRYFHNFFGQFQLNKKLGIIIGFDFGVEQKARETSKYNEWYSPVLIMKYTPTSRISIAARAEYYSDKNQVIINSKTLNGFRCYGYSLNIDYFISENIVGRIEGRNLSSPDPVFYKDENLIKEDYFITTALALSF
jgi:hypothetical protein